MNKMEFISQLKLRKRMDSDVGYYFDCDDIIALAHQLTEPNDAMVERMAKEVYEAMRWAITHAPHHIHPPEWQEGGNSLVQDRARQAAIAAMKEK